MSHSSLQRASSRLLAFCALGVAIASAAKVPPSDINGPEKRRAMVELAVKLTKPATPPALPADLISPFSPPGFDLPDPDDPKNIPPTVAGKPAAQPKAVTDRDTLEQIASKITPTGTMIAGTDTAQWRLNFGKSSVKVGTHFTVTLNGQDYDLELASIDRTTFTLRLNREEITRPIKPGKSQ